MRAATTSTIPVEPRRDNATRRFVRNPLAMAGAVTMALIVLAVALAPLLAGQDPTVASVREAMLPPLSPNHLLGTDTAGRDVWSRLLYGGQISLLGAALALIVAAAIGIPTGLLAGYYGRWFDSGSVWWNNLIQSMPGIVVLLAARAVLGPSIWISMATYGVMLSPGFYRVVRTAVINVRGELYVDAAKVSGLRDPSIIGRHILTVVRAPIIIQTSLLFGIALAIQSGLEFLGVGDNNLPSWGNMLNEGFKNIYRDPVMLMWPTLAIGLTCAALVIIGNGLRDALEERGTAARRRAPRANTAPTSARINVVQDPPVFNHPGEASADPAPLLRVQDLEVSYGHGDGRKVVVHDVSLEVRAGEVLGLVGESGSGKTQTAFSVMGLLPQGGRVSRGSIQFDNRELASGSDRMMRELRGTGIAYIPQEPMSNLDPSFRIGTQLVDPIIAKLKVSRREARETAFALLERVGIPDPQRTFDAYPHEISGGMAQRVLIAGAVSCKPRLLIADEPTTALDVTVQAEVLDLLRELQAEYGIAVILVTHNFGVVADICDRVAVMKNGAIVEMADVHTVFAAPQHPYTQMLLSSTLEGAPSRAELDAHERTI
jgi:ABC-type dipeptide/oligopeptide/nickel transport system ATPase component/ABC-type dipeptide/oligopeptide/nickel transport system permease subunit